MVTIPFSAVNGIGVWRSENSEVLKNKKVREKGFFSLVRRDSVSVGEKSRTFNFRMIPTFDTLT